MAIVVPLNPAPTIAMVRVSLTPAQASCAGRR